MKRSPMPPRRQPMSRGSKQLSRKAPIRSTGAPKSGKTTGKKSAGPRPLPVKVVAAVRARSGGLCEIGLECGGLAQAVERAHRTGKGAGGPGGRGRAASNSPSNLMDACRRDHDRVDRAKVTDAYLRGHKIHRHGLARPHEVPVLHAGYGWVLLDDHGGWRSAPAAAVRGEHLLPVLQISRREYDLGETGAVDRALARFGHLDCGGHSFRLDEVLTCACGAELLVVTLLEAE
ncbi:hypothetical protein JOL79_11650 [Microbispora sp. RL4-1S]|uniref:HNH endonuclease n=1 Tax=Microbispora oryzae TaxID=2806554 RepID=A0A940WPE3_9ACTN|nr:hypothetical protein [Microbispora oryzae]MBP2704469.1 hypothetical protein [Microbispora oryzae]